MKLKRNNTFHIFSLVYCDLIERTSLWAKRFKLYKASKFNANQIVIFLVLTLSKFLKFREVFCAIYWRVFFRHKRKIFFLWICNAFFISLNIKKIRVIYFLSWFLRLRHFSTFFGDFLWIHRSCKKNLFSVSWIFAKSARTINYH